jgi:hypothetical protein
MAWSVKDFLSMLLPRSIAAKLKKIAGTRKKRRQKQSQASAEACRRQIKLEEIGEVLNGKQCAKERSENPRVSRHDTKKLILLW